MNIRKESWDESYRSNSFGGRCITMILFIISYKGGDHSANIRKDEKGIRMNTNYDFNDFTSTNTFAAEGSSESSGTREMTPVEKGCLIAATAAAVTLSGVAAVSIVKTFKYF